MADLIERKLKHDIHEKNTLRKQMERYMKAVSQWKNRLANLKNFREQKKCAASIMRYIAEVERLRVKLNRMNEDADKNLRKAGKFSDHEVKGFCSQLEKEIRDIEAGNESEKNNVAGKKVIAEIKNARTKIAELKGKGNLQEKIEKARRKVSEDIEEIERATGKTIQLNRHLRNVSEGARSPEAGTSSGDRDEFLCTQELKRIAREKAVYNRQDTVI